MSHESWKLTGGYDKFQRLEMKREEDDDYRRRELQEEMDMDKRSEEDDENDERN
jgi:hypothetical protein